MRRTRGKDSLSPANRPRVGRKRIVHVYTEGKLTEPMYIDVLKKVIDERGIHVEVHIANAKSTGSHRKPIDLVELAVPLMRKLTKEAKNNRLPEDMLPQVWCLFDRDDHQELDRVFKQAEQGHVRVGFSHPCFEVWRLLHHKEVSGTFNQVCDLVTNRLPFKDEVEKIKEVASDQVLGRFDKAKQRALRMNAQHEDHVPLQIRDPYTDVFHFVEQGLGLASY